jgi:hypothetical protein
MRADIVHGIELIFAADHNHARTAYFKAFRLAIPDLVDAADGNALVQDDTLARCAGRGSR